MKKHLLILFVILFTSFTGFAQDEVAEDKGGKLLERMQLYIQKKLDLTKDEAEKFSPIFLRYISELRRTHREFKTDRPMLQLKIAEVRVKFRDQFKPIINEQRANRVFQHQKEFEDKIRDAIIEKRLENRQGMRRNRALL
jgi:nitrate reductase assembly molybdenum cofactor insertion protein NarJ